MKKGIFNLLVAMVFITTSTFANNITSISTDGGKAFILDTKTWKSQFISVEIRDIEGTLIFDDTYSTQNDKKFNFESLPSGEYTITLSDDLKSTRQGFVINTNEIILQSDVKTTYKPVINVHENYIDLNYMADSKNASVSIYDENNTLLNIRFKDNKAINKRFDTSNLPLGSYTINVSSKNSSYSKNFQK